MSSPLYNTEILRLAARTAEWPRLPDPDGSAEARAPVCGSRIALDVTVAGGQISAVGFAIHSCALGQASAAILADNICGHDLVGAQSMLTDLKALLAGEQGAEDAAHYTPLARARDYPARHGAILLPFEAAVQAMSAALAKAVA
jgi:NifU-like protein involved in Fe-S cluster formation